MPGPIKSLLFAMALCLSFALMAHDIIIASSDTITERVLDFAMYYLSDLPSEQPLVLMVPSWFSVRNIRYQSTLFLCSCDMSSFLSGSSASHSCSWFSSFNNASFHFSPNSVMPCFMLLQALVGQSSCFLLFICRNVDSGNNSCLVHCLSDTALLPQLFW